MRALELALAQAAREGWVDPEWAQRVLAECSARPGDVRALLTRFGLPADSLARLEALASRYASGSGHHPRLGHATHADQSFRRAGTADPLEDTRRAPAPRDPAASSRRSSNLIQLMQGPRTRGDVAGTRFGPYWVQGEIARGAMGAVFRARHESEDWDVALKVLLAGDQASDKQRKRLVREVRATLALDHPAIIKVYDAGEEGGIPYMAMEFVQGETLEDRLEGYRVRPLVQVIATLARGLEQAHAQGIIHRDVKPANILLREEDGSPVLTDFGIVRDLNNQSADLTKSGAAVGTPAYMAPEQISGPKPYPATDVHALAAILYEGLTGQAPFGGENVLALFQQIINDAPTPPGKLNPKVPPALEAIILKALEKDPQRRYQHGGELAEALETWLAGGMVAQRRLPSPVLISGGVVLAALGVAGAVLALSGGGGGDPVDPVVVPPVTVTARPSVTPVAVAQPLQRLTLQPGPLLGMDTYVRNDNLYINDNYGADVLLLVGDRPGRTGGEFRTLLQYDLAQLPAGAVIRAASLELWLLGSEFEDKDVTLQVHLIVPTVDANGRGQRQTPWLEGTSLSDEFLDGVAWDGDYTGKTNDIRTRSERPELSQPAVDDWTDFGHGHNGVVATTHVHAGSEPRFFALDVAPAVRAWLDGSCENLGLRVRHADEGPPREHGVKWFASSDHPVAEQRPRLVIEYEGAPPADGPDLEAARAEALAASNRELDVLSVRSAESLEAMQLATRAIQAAPFNGVAFYRRAQLHLLRGRADRAHLDLRRMDAVQVPCETPEALALRAMIRLEVKEIENARADIERVYAVAPTDPAVASRYALALTYAPRPDPKRAMFVLTKHHNADQLSWEGLLAAGRATHLLERVEDAMAFLQMATELEREQGLRGQRRSLEPALNLGLVLRLEGRFDEAEAAYLYALELDPNSREAQNGLRHVSVGRGGG